MGKKIAHNSIVKDNIILIDDFEIFLHNSQNEGRIHRYPLNTKKLDKLSEQLTDKYLEIESPYNVVEYNNRISSASKLPELRDDKLFDEKASMSSLIGKFFCDFSNFSDNLYIDLDSIYCIYLEEKKLKKRQIKNCFKRLLKGFKVTIVVSSFQNLISRIISPNLFYNYVNDEDDNRVAINNFSFSFLSI
jgi:hypothetical protein